MLLDLVRVLPAAALVGVLPGWFWAGCLCATADRAERLAYAVAFSTTLVPSAALVQVHLFGVGVTPAITVLSVLLVSATGLTGYLKFGPAKGSDEPLVSRPVSLGLPSLMLLIVAFALVLAALLGAVLTERAATPIALSVLAAGIAHRLASPRGDAVPSEPPSRLRREIPGIRRSLISAARWLLLSMALLLVLLRSYLGPTRYDWPFPRGVDKYEHAVMVGMMLSEGSTDSFKGSNPLRPEIPAARTWKPGGYNMKESVDPSESIMPTITACSYLSTPRGNGQSYRKGPG